VNKGRTQVVVVGGGILATMHTVFAVRSGATVIPLDCHERPRGASLRNFGLVWVSWRGAGSDESVALIEQLARDVIGSPLPRIGRRWAGVNHELADVSDEELYLRCEVAAGVVAVTGAGGRGMTLAPAIAEDTFR